jgi:hypothetical protein
LIGSDADLCGDGNDVDDETTAELAIEIIRYAASSLLALSTLP